MLMDADDWRVTKPKAFLSLSRAQRHPGRRKGSEPRLENAEGNIGREQSVDSPSRARLSSKTQPQP